MDAAFLHNAGTGGGLRSRSDALGSYPMAPLGRVAIDNPKSKIHYRKGDPPFPPISALGILGLIRQR